MDFSKNVPTARKNIVIGEKLIVAGDDAWQIHNLTGISRREAPVVLDAAEPTFIEKEPIGSLNLPAFIIWVAIGFGTAVFFNNAILFWIGVAIGVFSIWNRKSSEKAAWARRKAEFEKRHSVWKKLKHDPPIVYSLTIETSAGSRPVFYSFDKEGIARIVKAVKNEMVNPEPRSTTYNINAIDLSGDVTVNNIGSTIYKQINREIRREYQ